MSSPLSADCQQILSDISAYLDGDLDEAACAGIVRHCERCARCAELVDGLKKTVGLCRQAATAPLPEPVRQRARESVRRLLDAEAERHDAPS